MIPEDDSCTAGAAGPAADGFEGAEIQIVFNAIVLRGGHQPRDGHCRGIVI